MRRYSRRLSTEVECSEYRDVRDCTRNTKCIYDYDEKECRQKRSPTSVTRSPYYQVSDRIPIDISRQIYSYLYHHTLRLVEYYPHNPRYIMENIMRVPEDEIVELLNYLPNTRDYFLQMLYTEITKYYSRRQLLRMIARSGHTGLLMLSQPHTRTELNQIMVDAAVNGHMEMVEMMLDLGADDLNQTIVLASLGGHLDIVERMVELGADNLDWALQSAELGGHPEVVEFLRDMGAVGL